MLWPCMQSLTDFLSALGATNCSDCHMFNCMVSSLMLSELLTQLLLVLLCLQTVGLLPDANDQMDQKLQHQQGLT